MTTKKIARRGRPFCENPKDKKITFRMDNELFQGLQLVASAERRGLCDTLRILIEDRVAREADIAELDARMSR